MLPHAEDGACPVSTARRIKDRMDWPPKTSNNEGSVSGGLSGRFSGRDPVPILSAFSGYPQNPGDGPRAGPVLVTGYPEPPSRFEIWSNRIFLVIRVIFWIELGMLLIVLPWTRVWTENNFLMRWPELRALLDQNFVRGAASGLGLLDIWIGIWDAVHYKDPKYSN